MQWEPCSSTRTDGWMDRRDKANSLTTNGCVTHTNRRTDVVSEWVTLPLCTECLKMETEFRNEINVKTNLEKAWKPLRLRCKPTTRFTVFLRS
jgi:hypothetical protein